MQKSLLKRYGKKIIIGGVTISTLYHLLMLAFKREVIRMHFSIGHKDLERPELSVGECVFYNQILNDKKEIGVKNTKVKDLETLRQDFLKLDGISDETEIFALINFMIEEESK